MLADSQLQAKKQALQTLIDHYTKEFHKGTSAEVMAIEMRRRGLSPEHVQMVVAKATGKQQEEEAVSPKTKAYRTMGVGFALFACGLGVTIISALGGGGAGVVFVYPTLGGLFLMVKGLFDRMKCPPEPSSAKARLSAD